MAHGHHWYGIIEMYQPDYNKQRQFAVFILAWALVSAGLSFNNTLKEHNNVYSQMHSTPDNSKTAYDSLHEAHPRSAHMDVPSQYWTMDWVMSPMHTKHSTPYSSIPVAQHLCMDGTSSCSPALWHTSLACNTTYSRPRVAKVIREVQPYIYKNTRKKWRHISPAFTCMAEKIGLYTLWLNNEHSWSMASTHNVNVLVTAVFVLFGIIALSVLLGAMTSANQGYGLQYNQAILTAFVGVYVVSSYLWASSVALDSDKNVHRPIGTASYFYSTISIVAALVIFNSSSVHEDDESAKEPEVGQAGEMAALTEYASPGFSQQRTFGSEMKGMNVGGFVKEQTRIGARIVVPASVADGQVDFTHMCTCLNRPVHSKFIYAQLFTLPLVLLALCIHGRNYGIDSQTQVVLVTSMAVVLIDCFLYRLWWAFNIHKGVMPRQQEDTEYHCMQIVTFLCSLFQIMIFLFYTLSELFPTSFRWIFISYISVVSVAKLIAVQGIHDNRYGGAYNVVEHYIPNFGKSTKLLLTSDIYLFALYVVAVSVVTWVYIIQDNLQYKPAWISTDSLDKQWGPGWQTFQSFAVAV